MNLPNLLTVFRIFLTFIFIFFLYQDSLLSTILALLVFTLASLTDFYDGYYARKHNLITRFGKIMDPIADKFLILSAFFIFMHMHLIAAWMFVVICAREVIVTGLRLVAMRRGIALAAEGAGKLKTVLQIVSVYLIMIFAVMVQLSIDIQWYQFWMIDMFMGAVVLITLWSGVSFIWKNRKEVFNVR